jgi:CheY-like chemotaxis protein
MEMVAYKKQVLINRTITVMGLGIGEEGVSLHTGGRNFPAGSVLELSLPLDEETIVVKGRVRPSQSPLSVELLFMDLDPADKRALRTYVADHAGPSAEPAKKKVLLVDDSRVQRLMHKNRLVLDGYAVSEAGDGLEAVEMLKKERFDVMVLDLTMPGLDGHGVLESMKRMPGLGGLPVLVLTAKATAEERQRVLSAGAADYLLKMTTSPIKLSERIARLLRAK